jgi:hypothetical protein
MIVTIHQPHFLPWLGYLDRMRQADLFILLDHVQYEAQNYQNRVRIKTGLESRWIIVPVFRKSQDERILDKVIDNQRDGRLRFGRKIFATLRHVYQGAPYFQKYAPALQELFDRRWEKLIDLNIALLAFLRQTLDIQTPCVRSSELGVTGKKSDLVLQLCQKVGATTFLGGLGGSRGYLDEPSFQRAGIEVTWQNFTHPRYSQHPRPENFIEGLSALDLLFNCGPESADILKGESPAYALANPV